MKEDRTTYTTALIRADDLSSGDIAQIGGEWVWVRDTFIDITDEIREEYAHLPDQLRNITAIVSKDGGMDDPVFVAVMYLHTPINHTRAHYAYSADEPEFRISALSMYDLVKIQVPVPKES
jgi:hypothetical protein